MNIYVSDAASKQMVTVDEVQNFGIGRDDGLRQVRKSAQDKSALADIAESEFTNDERMGQH